MKTVLSAASALLLGAAPAHATLQIAFMNGGSSFFCADQTSCDLDGAAHNLLLLNTIVGNIKITGTFALSGPDELSVSNLTISNLSALPQTLEMAVGDTGFLSPTAFIRSSASLTFLTGGSGSGNLAFFADHADAQPASNVSDLPGLLLFAAMGATTKTPDSFSGTHDTAFAASGPFSMSESAALTIPGGGSITGFNESMTAIVPEASTWTMMGLGFLGLAFAGWRSKSVSRVSGLRL